MANISAIKLPDGVTYDLVDRVSTIDVATTSANGLMSSSDKTKLDGIASGAEVNYVSNITNNYETLRDDPPSLYVKSSTITYNGSYQTILLTVAAIGKKNGVCGLDASSKVPASMIPSGYANVQSDWNEVDSTADAFIKNKPTIPIATTLAPIMDGMATVGSDTRWAKGDHVHPTDTSRVPTTRTVNGKALSTNIWLYAENIPCEDGENDVEAALAEKQNELVSGTNIKTINGTSVLGSGNITVGGDSNVQSDWNEADSTDDAYIKNKPTIPSKNVWYGTCSTSASIQQKAVTTLSGDFTLDEGNILLVEFASSNSYDGTATLSVDELTAEAIYVNGSPTNDHRWRAGEVVIFVYDGYHFNLIEQGMATTSYYGITKLSSSTSSTSELIAATPKAVKVAYDEATDATATPTASKKSKFDSDAHMNSTDMTTGSGGEVETFVNGLNVNGGGVVKTNVTPTSGTNYSGYGNCYYEVMGKLVHFHIGIQGLTANTSATIYTMPSGLRPSTTMAYKGGGGNSDSTSHLFANADGTIAVNSPQQYAIGDIWYFAL